MPRTKRTPLTACPENWRSNLPSNHSKCIFRGAICTLTVKSSAPTVITKIQRSKVTGIQNTGSITNCTPTVKIITLTVMAGAPIGKSGAPMVMAILQYFFTEFSKEVDKVNLQLFNQMHVDQALELV